MICTTGYSSILLSISCFTLTCRLVSAADPAPQDAGVRPPNVVLILVDDLGYEARQFINAHKHGPLLCALHFVVVCTGRDGHVKRAVLQYQVHC